MTTIAAAAPAIVRTGSSRDSIHVEPLTNAIGAELSNIDLGVASRDPALVAEIRSLLLRYRVLFFRDQNMTRAEHVAFARRFGELEDHPVAGSDPDHPGMVRIYKDRTTGPDHYENAWHCDATWRDCPPVCAGPPRSSLSWSPSLPLLHGVASDLERGTDNAIPSDRLARGGGW